MTRLRGARGAGSLRGVRDGRRPLGGRGLGWLRDGRDGCRLDQLGRPVLLVALALAGAAAALTLSPSTALNTFVSSSSPDYRATQTMYRRFGSDPVVVLVRGSVAALLEPAAMRTLSQLEACLAGQELRLDSGLAAYVPVAGARARPLGGSPCAALMRTHAARVVYGPATFLNHAVAAVNTEIGSVTLGAVSTVRAAEAEAQRLARREGLDPAQTAAAVQAAGALALEHELAGAGSTTTGGRSSSTTPSKSSPTTTSGKSSPTAAPTTGATQGLLAGIPSIADPAFLRQIVFGSPTGTTTPAGRLAYLFPSAGAAVIQVRLRANLSARQQQQAIGWVRQAVEAQPFRLRGVSYTVTGEPVLLNDLGHAVGSQLILLLGVGVGLMALVLLVLLRRRLRLLPLATALGAVAVTIGLTALLGGSLTLADVAVFPVLLGLAVDYGVQLRSGTPRRATGTAALATAAGFLALRLSPVPMVRGFGLLLVVGVILAFLAAAFVAPEGAATWLGPPRRLPQPLLASVYGAGEILSGLVASLLGHPRRVLAVAAALCVTGWALSGGAAVQSDITRLVPSDLSALRNLKALERVTGTSGEIDVSVSGTDVTTARTVAWMRAYGQRVSASLGGELRPGLSLPSLLDTAGGRLGAVPGYFQRAVLTSDHHHALLSFGIRLMPLERQRRVIERMRALLHPPAGTAAALTGLPVLAADAEGALASTGTRLLMLAIGVALVALALLAALRDLRRVAVPLIPIVLGTGWSALLVHILRIPLNPLSATLATLVIAITTEFSVLLAERIRRERASGVTRAQAVDAAYRTTGIAVLTSALTALAGFAVLVLSNITMLREFGVLALVELSVSVAGVMLVLPAAAALTA